MTKQSDAFKLINLTIGGQSVIYEMFQKNLECPDGSIRKLELTYFSAAIATAIYLRVGKGPNREQTLDVFAKEILEGSIRSGKERISFGAAVAEYQRRYAEYDGLLALIIDRKSSSTGNPAATLLLHAFECVTGQSARGHMLKIVALSSLIEAYVSDYIEFVQTKM